MEPRERWVERPTTERVREVTCEECGGWFEPKRSDQRFCSDRCRYRAAKKAQRGDEGNGTESG